VCEAWVRAMSACRDAARVPAMRIAREGRVLALTLGQCARY